MYKYFSGGGLLAMGNIMVFLRDSVSRSCKIHEQAIYIRQRMEKYCARIINGHNFIC